MIAAKLMKLVCAAAVAAVTTAASAADQRIVSLGGATTEILYALGLDKQVVAVDSTSLYPAVALKEKANVGYLRQLSPEGVIGLAPTLILAAEGAGPKQAVSVISAANIPFVTVPEQFGGEGVIERIQVVARATGVEERGQCLEKIVRNDLDTLAAIRAKITRPVKIMFVLSFASGRPMVAGRNTAADGMIKLAGAVNAVGDFEGYKPVGDEAIIAAAPDAVLAMKREGLDLSGNEVFTQPAFALTPAFAQRRFIAMEGSYLLSFGPRAARAARDLATQLYPELTAGALPSENANTAGACGASK